MAFLLVFPDAPRYILEAAEPVRDQIAAGAVQMTPFELELCCGMVLVLEQEYCSVGDPLIVWRTILLWDRVFLGAPYPPWVRRYLADVAARLSALAFAPPGKGAIDSAVAAAVKLRAGPGRTHPLQDDRGHSRLVALQVALYKSDHPKMPLKQVFAAVADQHTRGVVRLEDAEDLALPTWASRPMSAATVKRHWHRWCRQYPKNSSH